MEFAEELRHFVTRCNGQSVGGLIIPGSRQATTAALLIGALAPQRVAFLLTPDTLGLPAQIAQLLGVTPDDWVCYREDHTNTLQVYRSLRVLIDAWADLPRGQIAVDVTGGTKPMSVGLAKAAYVLNIKTLYIESDFSVDATGRPIPQPGTQRLVPPDDPYAFFGDLEAAEATRLFNAHDYTGAKRIFTDLAKRVPERHDYGAQAALAAAYAAWDVFDLPAARDGMRAFLARDCPTNLAAHQPTFVAQSTALTALIRIAGRAAGRGAEALTTLANIDEVQPLLGSLYANACRRAAQGRYDMAALLCYRCLELLSQHRLARRGVLSERPDFTQVCAQITDFERRYERVVRGQGRGRFYGLPDRAFGLFVGYMLLAALDDDLVRDYPIARIEQRAEIRNKSILAHGYRLITQAEYAEFADVLEQLLDRFFVVSGKDRQAWAQSFTFVGLA